MRETPYYSIRTGKNPNAPKFDLLVLRELFHETYLGFDEKSCFNEAVGYDCVDGYVPGTLGVNIQSFLFRKLRKMCLWPINKYLEGYSEADLFDMIEFLYDYVSNPIDGYFHDWQGCGWHYRTFDRATGRQEFRKEINDILCDYEDGFELTETGEICTLTDSGLGTLLEAPLPDYDLHNVEERVNAAIQRFRRSKSSLHERRDAIRDLADVLEFLRPKAKDALSSKDEGDLFNLANNFGIRHHNEKQKTDYDGPIWYSWMFYYYIATIHASLRLIKRKAPSGGS